MKLPASPILLHNKVTPWIQRIVCGNAILVLVPNTKIACAIQAPFLTQAISPMFFWCYSYHQIYIRYTSARPAISLPMLIWCYSQHQICMRKPAPLFKLRYQSFYRFYSKNQQLLTPIQASFL